MNEEWNEQMPSWKSGSHIYPIDGAAHDVGADETPWAYRDTRWSQVIIGVDPDPAGARRFATGRSATGMRSIRIRPAVPTSTS